MNKPLHYALIGGLVLFIGLYIPFTFVGERGGSSAYTKATDYSFTNKSNPAATFSSSFHSVASMPYVASNSASSHTVSTSWNQHASANMAMPLSFNTTKWTPSAPKMFVEQDFGGTFVAAVNAGQTSAATPLAAARPVVRRANNSTSTNSSTASPAIAQAASKAPAMQAPRYIAHQSMVQQPFSNALPSEVSTSFAGDTPDGISNRKNGFVTPSDPGDRSEESPVGEPWIMLIFAAAAALTITLRKRLQKAQA